MNDVLNVDEASGEAKSITYVIKLLLGKMSAYIG